MEKFGIIGAEEQEIELLKAYFKGSCIKDFGLVIYDGSIFGKPVVFTCAGVGKVNASMSTQVLISNFNAKLIVNCGIAGAISDTLSILDFVISEKTFQHDFDASYFGYPLGFIPYTESIFWKASQKLILASEKAFTSLRNGNFSFDSKNIFDSSAELKQDFQKTKLVKAVIASGDVFVTSQEQRNRIKSICAETACCEMEGAAIAQVASINKLPFVILRSISDSADESNLDKISYEEFSKRAAYMASSVILKLIEDWN